MPTKTKSKTSILLVALLSLSMIACSTSSVITEIEVAQTVISLGAPVVAAFAGPGAAIAQQVMGGLATGLGCVLTAAQAAGATTSTVAVAFDTCFGTALEQNLPVGTPAYIVAAVTAAVSVVKILVNKFGAKSARTATPPVKIKLTFTDHQRIKDIQSKLGAVSAQFKK